jgi:hypothetical protein
VSTNDAAPDANSGAIARNRARSDSSIPRYSNRRSSVIEDEGVAAAEPSAGGSDENGIAR